MGVVCTGVRSAIPIIALCLLSKVGTTRGTHTVSVGHTIHRSQKSDAKPTAMGGEVGTREESTLSVVVTVSVSGC